tara:strand:- start:281 stop:727 length:447 start_codon:yes stop_codon:yes gene_type:complete
MAILDKTIKPFIQDRDSNVFIGIDYPYHKSSGVEGWFASTATTIESVKNNIKMLLNTERGERLMQPALGMSLRRFLFEQITEETIENIKNEIVATLSFWLPFVEIQQLEVSNRNSDQAEGNKLAIKILFNITRAPNSLESVQVVITGE